jgi:hypothetical protein
MLPADVIGGGRGPLHDRVVLRPWQSRLELSSSANHWRSTPVAQDWPEGLKSSIATALVSVDAPGETTFSRPSSTTLVRSGRSGRPDERSVREDLRAAERPIGALVHAARLARASSRPESSATTVAESTLRAASVRAAFPAWSSSVPSRRCSTSTWGSPRARATLAAISTSARSSDVPSAPERRNNGDRGAALSACVEGHARPAEHVGGGKIRRAKNREDDVGAGHHRGCLLTGQPKHATSVRARL